MGEEVGEVAGEVLHENSEEGEAAEDLQGNAALLWGNVHGLVSLLMIERLPGGQEQLERLAEQTVRDPSLRGAAVKGRSSGLLGNER